MTPRTVAYCLQLQGARKKKQDLSKGGNVFLQNVGLYLLHYIASQKQKAYLREDAPLLIQMTPAHNLPL